MQRLDLISNPMFLFLAEEANIAYEKYETEQLKNVALNDAMIILRRDLIQARLVIREQFEELNQLEQRLERKNRNLAEYARVTQNLRMENIRLRRLARYDFTPIGRNMPPSFRRIRARVEEPEPDTETEVEETDIEITHMGGQDESDEDFDITR